ncbi:MAG TPA: helix-turn-helix transcriptional regulator [Waterburya sp.]|jgi:DNA-binding CsgD family transcriptional regulator
MLASKLNGHLEPLPRGSFSDKQLKVPHSQNSKPPYFLQAIIEGFVDGVLILTETGEWVHTNECARRICRQLSSERFQHNLVPSSIWQICSALIESRELFPDQSMIIEAEIDTNEAAVLRVRVRWLDLEGSPNPYLLVTLEDRKQSTQKAAIAEAKKYDLTPREAEVWLLRRAHYSYKEIAAKLYITVNTVKKHLKSVYAKQQVNLWSEEELEIG